MTWALVAVFLAIVAALFGLGIIEASLLHLRRSAVAARAEHGDARTARLLLLLDRLPRVMNAVLLAVLFAQVSGTTVAGVAARRLSDDVGVTITTVLVTVVLFVYGEAIPKTIAIRHPLRYARRLVPIIRWLDVLLGPFVAVLVRFAELQAPTTDGLREDSVTEDELRHITDEAAAAGEIEPSDADLIERSFALGDLRADRLLVPVEQVVSTASTCRVDDALGVAISAGHRRLAVYETDPHRLIGCVRLRDLAAADADEPSTPVSRVAQPGLFLPADTRVIEVLRIMQSTEQHLAIFQDANGRCLGIMTVEDIVEELVGSIQEPPPK